MEEITLYIVVGYHHTYEDDEEPNVRRKFYANKNISEKQIIDFFHKQYGGPLKYTCFWIEKRIPLLVQKKQKKKISCKRHFCMG